jgi:hypothetical protein
LDDLLLLRDPPRSDSVIARTFIYDSLELLRSRSGVGVGVGLSVDLANKMLFSFM